MTQPPASMSIQLRADEVRMLRTLSVQLRARLEGPVDPIVRRLFPQVVRGDGEADRDGRQLIHDDLLRQRLSRLDMVLDLLSGNERTIELTDDQPHLLLGVLNDLRLALAVQAGLDRPEEDRGATTEETTQAQTLMDWLAWWQENLLRTVDPDALRFYDEESDLSA